jgi:LuxR family maltose regulon positive regulatory protein
LVTEWVCGSPREVAWISLDDGDNDPVQFLTYLIAALQQVDGRIGQSVQQLLQSPQRSAPQNMATSVINDITAADAALTLVLDDYRLITSPSVHEIVQILLEHQPPTMHLVISTREDPPLQLPRLRAQGQVTEIRERDLRFTAEEAATFLNQTMGLRLSPEAVAALEARTEGWIVGLQLAALALQETPGDVETFVAAFTGDDRYVTDYLVAEVLERQPKGIRDFLHQTAILERLTAPLCNVMTGRRDSQEILEQLEASNLFLIPIDNRREWYRYHRLFAEVLRAMLDTEEHTKLHQRAAGWYEAQGHRRQAISHALAYAARSEDWEAPEQLIGMAAEEAIYTGNLLTVRGWLDALPEARVRAQGELATYKGWVLALAGDLDLAAEFADAAEAALHEAGSAVRAGADWRSFVPRRKRRADTAADLEARSIQQGRLLALRSFIAVFGPQDYGDAIELATGALRELPEDQAHWRVIALWALAESQERSSKITQAIATLREARRTVRSLGHQVFAAPVELFLATGLNLHGERRAAIEVCKEAIEWYSDPTGRPSPVTGMIISRLGTLYYEANQLETARQHVEQGLALSQQLGVEDSTVFSLSCYAPVLFAQGEADAALEALHKAYRMSSQTGLADVEWYPAWQAHIHLQQGDLAAALRWAETAGLTPKDEPHYLRMDQHLSYGRVLLSQGRLSDARRLLARLERFSRERGLVRWLITVLALQGLVAARSGNAEVARDRIVHALELAAPEEYYRAFLEEGHGVLPLLHEARRVAPLFVDQLLDYAGISAPAREITSEPQVVQPLVEPLSQRELEVLRLIAAGLSNREIAQELVIAVGTVKRHINNIYGKLGVHRRTEAVARARDLGMLRS